MSIGRSRRLVGRDHELAGLAGMMLTRALVLRRLSAARRNRLPPADPSQDV